MVAMRVVFLASTLKVGGAERITGLLSERLRTRGFTTSWALLREAGTEGLALRERGVEVIDRLAPGRFGFGAIPVLAGHFRRAGARAVYCLDHQNAVFSGVMAARLAGVPARFVAIHTTGLWGGGRSLPRGVRLVLPGLTRVIAVAEGQARYLREREGVPADRLVVIRNGIDPADFAPTPARQAAGAALRTTLLAGAPGPLLGVVAALRPEKGHEVLFAALPELLRRWPGLVVACVGDGPARAAVAAAAGAAGVADCVRLLGARDDIPDLLQAFDLVVLPSHPAVETLPLSLIEAMAAGRAVVATRVGSVDELVQEGLTGRLVPPSDPAALGAALAEALDDPARRSAWGAAGRARAAEFTLDATVARTAALLKEHA